ncbi:MAG: hypothetical protein AAF086_03395 [Planctomycetota bacterium]
MKTTPTRWISLLTLALAMGVGLPALAERGDGPDDGFGPPEGHGGPPLLDDQGQDDGKPRGFRFNEQDLDAAQSIVLRVYPELTERLAKLRAEDPRQFKQTLERRFPRVRFLVELQKRDPAMFELRMADIRLDRQTDLLAKQLREARDADDKDRYEDLRDAIEAKVTEHFDIRQSIRAMEIENLKLKLEELEERLDDRDDDRKDLIEQRVDELAGRDW